MQIKEIKIGTFYRQRNGTIVKVTAKHDGLFDIERLDGTRCVSFGYSELNSIKTQPGRCFSDNRDHELDLVEELKFPVPLIPGVYRQRNGNIVQVDYWRSDNQLLSDVKGSGSITDTFYAGHNAEHWALAGRQNNNHETPNDLIEYIPLAEEITAGKYIRRDGKQVYIHMAGSLPKDFENGFTYYRRKKLVGRQNSIKETPYDLIAGPLPKSVLQSKETEVKLQLPIQEGKLYKRRDGKVVRVKLNTWSPYDESLIVVDSKPGSCSLAFPDTGRICSNMLLEHNNDLVEGPIDEKPLPEPLTEEIEVGQSYRTRDGEVVTIHQVEHTIGVARFTYKGAEKFVFSGTLPADKEFTGRNDRNMELPQDLVARIETPMNTYCAQDTSSTLTAKTQQDRESLATSINEALERVERGDKPLDQNGATLNHKELVLAMIRGSTIEWVNKKPAEIVFSEPVNAVPNGEKYYRIVRYGYTWTVESRRANLQEGVRRDAEHGWVHLTQEAAQNHAKILNDFGKK